MDRIEKIAWFVHQCWCSFMLGLGQEHNLWPEPGQIESIKAGIEYYMANPSASPAQMHEKWMEHKLADGWTYGPVKDVAAKTHPDLVPFSDLLFCEQMKDRNFINAVQMGLLLFPKE